MALWMRLLEYLFRRQVLLEHSVCGVLLPISPKNEILVGVTGTGYRLYLLEENNLNGNYRGNRMRAA